MSFISTFKYFIHIQDVKNKVKTQTNTFQRTNLEMKTCYIRYQYMMNTVYFNISGNLTLYTFLSFNTTHMQTALLMVKSSYRKVIKRTIGPSKSLVKSCNDKSQRSPHISLCIQTFTHKPHHCEAFVGGIPSSLFFYSNFLYFSHLISFLIGRYTFCLFPFFFFHKYYFVIISTKELINFINMSRYMIL